MGSNYEYLGLSDAGMDDLDYWTGDDRESVDWQGLNKDEVNITYCTTSVLNMFQEAWKYDLIAIPVMGIYTTTRLKPSVPPKILLPVTASLPFPLSHLPSRLPSSLLQPSSSTSALSWSPGKPAAPSINAT